MEKKSLLFDKTFAWVRKKDNALFNATMGSYYGAEDCEFVGVYLFNQ